MNTSLYGHVFSDAEIQGCGADMEGRGWTIISSFFDETTLTEICNALGPSLELRNAIRRRNGVIDNTDGTLHHLLADAPCYVDLLGKFTHIDCILTSFFSGKYILNSYGGVINNAGSHAYVHMVHRDIRFSSPTKRFMINALVMLDDFTLENGATHLLSSSQNILDKPDDAYFFEHADRAIGRRGSLLLFDSRLWHATGKNSTAAPRRALTLTFTSPFFKQQLDYPRLYKNVWTALPVDDPWLMQTIGFNSRVPESLDQFYLPVDQRFYKRGQD